MRIVFAGTPAPAVPTLMRLIESSHDVVAVITRPPARGGRGRSLVSSPVAIAARDAEIPLIEASSLKGEDTIRRVTELNADLGVVVAYGALIPQALLDAPPHGWVNLHFSDLPRWRGAAPVQWSILSGDEQTASSVFQLEAGLDTGPVFSRVPVTIGHETAGELLEKMAELGAGQVIGVVDEIEAGTARAIAQDEADPRASHARRLSHEDGFIDFTLSADEVDRRIRAVTPNPGAWTMLPDGKRMRLSTVEVCDDSQTLEAGSLRISKRSVDVGCSQGAVTLGRVAPAGRGWMDAAAWARGARLDDAARFGKAGE